MTKLTDTQLIVLSSAAQHDEGLATRPANLNVAAAMKVASSLVAKGLAREIRAKADAPVWHENDDGRFALKITRAGREAIGVDDEEEQQHAAPSSATLDGSKSKKSRSKRTAKKDATKTPSADTKAARGKTAGDAESSSAQVRAGSKQAKIIELMKRTKGATLNEMVKATEWLPHTTRAALTGLRRRGFALERINDETKGSVYRIKSDRAPVAA
jgi:septum formation inhibitor MinC